MQSDVVFVFFFRQGDVYPELHQEEERVRNTWLRWTYLVVMEIVYYHMTTSFSFSSFVFYGSFVVGRIKEMVSAGTVRCSFSSGYRTGSGHFD